VELTRQDAIETIAARPVVRIDGQANLRRAAELLTEELIGVAVVRGYHPPALVSERDIVRAIAEGADPDQDRVESIMTLDVACAAPRDSIADVARTMLANDVRHIPVVDEGVVVTVVSARDVLRALVEEPT